VFSVKQQVYNIKWLEVVKMANVVSEENLKEVNDFSKSFEKLTEKNKSYLLGYMDCLTNTQETVNKEKAVK
jgi:hypothetical protein